MTERPFRGVPYRPMAMGRPSIEHAEARAIEEAMAAMPAGSKRCRAMHLARRVVAEIVAAAARHDPLDIAMAEARRVLANDPVARLANMLAGEMIRARLARFESRACIQLPPDEWSAETNEIARLLELRLAEKFRRARN